MSGFVLAMVGFVGAMSIPAFLVAVAESAASSCTRALYPRVKAVVQRVAGARLLRA